MVKGGSTPRSLSHLSVRRNLLFLQNPYRIREAGVHFILDCLTLILKRAVCHVVDKNILSFKLHKCWSDTRAVNATSVRSLMGWQVKHRSSVTRANVRANTISIIKTQDTYVVRTCIKRTQANFGV